LLTSLPLKTEAEVLLIDNPADIDLARSMHLQAAFSRQLSQ
jgi:hypothetical protein